MIRNIVAVELNRSSGMNVFDVREFAGGAIRGAKLVPLATVPRLPGMSFRMVLVGLEDDQS